ncbi:hypothetical protein UlMin_012495 [Ulmus minor]
MLLKNLKNKAGHLISRNKRRALPINNFDILLGLNRGKSILLLLFDFIFLLELFEKYQVNFVIGFVSENDSDSIAFVIDMFFHSFKSISHKDSSNTSIVVPLPLFKGEIEEFVKVVFTLFQDLDFTFLEMNPFTLVNGKPYPLDMRGELDDTCDCFSSTNCSFLAHVGDLGFANELGNYAEYSGTPNKEEVLQYARVVIDCATFNPDGCKRALVIGGGIANFTDVVATFNNIIRAFNEKESELKAAWMHIYVRKGGPNYQRGLAKMRVLGEEIGIPIEVYGLEATMIGI